MKWTTGSFRGRPNVHLCKVTPDYKIAAYRTRTSQNPPKPCYTYEFLYGAHNEVITRDLIVCRPNEGLPEIQARLESRLENYLYAKAAEIDGAIRVLKQTREEAGQNA